MKIVFNLIVAVALVWYLCGCAAHRQIDNKLGEWNDGATRVVQKIKSGVGAKVKVIPLDDFRVVVKPTGIVQNHGVYVGIKFKF